MKTGQADCLRPQILAGGERLSSGSLVDPEQAAAISARSRVTQQLAYVCSDDLHDYAILPLLWEAFSDIAIIRPENAGDMAAFLAAGWCGLAPRAVPTRQRFGAETRIAQFDAQMDWVGPADAAKPGPADSVYVATSGTTGSPRYVCLPKARLIANARASFASFDARLDGAAIVPCLSLGSSYGLVMQLLTPVLHGLPIAADLIGRFGNPLATYRARPGHHAAVLSPEQLRAYVHYLDSSAHGGGALTLMCGGDFLPPATTNFTFAKLRQSAVIFHTYGLTELGPRVSTRRIEGPIDEKSICSVGLPIAGVRAFPATPDPARAGLSELMVDTVHGGHAYFSGEVYRGHGSSIAATGDEGEVLPDGSLRVFGRMAGAARSNLLLKQIENMALEDESLQDCTVSYADGGKVSVKLKAWRSQGELARKAITGWQMRAREYLASANCELVTVAP